MYDPLNLICQTPYGENWAAVDFDSDRKVSLLKLHSYLLDRDPEKVWKSVESGLALKHPRYLSPFACDREKKWILTEPYGEKVSDLIAVGPLPSIVVRRVLHDLLDVLSYFESRNFIHGDIRPEMLFLPYDETLPRRVQLGFSPGPRLGDEILLGTRSMKYYTPEWINHEFGETTAATDLYSLAFTAMELLLGPEFDSKYELLGTDYETRWIVLHSDTTERLPPIEHLIPGISKDLYRFLHCILQRKVLHRPKSAEEARKFLDDVPKTVVLPTLNEMFLRKQEAENNLQNFVDADSNSSEFEETATKSSATTLASDYAGKLEKPPEEEESVVDRTVRENLQRIKQKLDDLQDSDNPDRKRFDFFAKQLHRPIVLFPLLGLFLTFALLAGMFFSTKPDEKKRPIGEGTASANNLPKAFPTSLLPKEGTAFDAETRLPLLATVRNLKDSAPLDMLLIRPGRFHFGASDNPLPGERSGETKEIKRFFYIGAERTTVKQYETLLSRSSPLETAKTTITHTEAERVCEAVGGRLPTETEWEFAASFEKSALPQAFLVDGPEWCSEEYTPGFMEKDVRSWFPTKQPLYLVKGVPQSGAAVRRGWRIPVPEDGAPDVGFRPVVEVAF